MGVLMLAQGRVTRGLVASAVLAGVLCVAATVAVDSWFWGVWTWPELDVLRFNTVENRSSEWGVLPWHWYWTHAIPRVLTAQLALLPFGLLSRQPCIALVATYIGLYSFLPHKEVRFLFPVLPALTVIAALGAAWLVKKWRRLGQLIVTGCVIGSFALAVVAVGVSGMNYPGA